MQGFNNDILDKLQKKITFEESWDKEIENIKNRRLAVSLWKKEKDKEKKERLKRKNRDF